MNYRSPAFWLEEVIASVFGSDSSSTCEALFNLS